MQTAIEAYCLESIQNVMLGEVKTISPSEASHSKFVKKKKKKRVGCHWVWSPSTADKSHGTAAVEMCSLMCYHQTHQTFTQAVSVKVTRDSLQTNMEWELSRNFNNVNGFAKTTAKACNKYIIIFWAGWTFWVLHFFEWQFGFVSSTVHDSRGLYDKMNGTFPIIWWQRHKNKKKLCAGGGLPVVLTKAVFENQVYFWEKLISNESNSLFLIGPSSVN